jgi:hypothetical protein
VNGMAKYLSRSCLGVTAVSGLSFLSDELELLRLLQRQVGGLGSLQDLLFSIASFQKLTVISLIIKPISAAMSSLL